MIAIGNSAVGDLFGSYCEQIERLIGEAKYRDAMANLQDFVRDFCPTKKRVALALCSRYHRWREAQALGLVETENINGIVQSCLELVDDIRDGQAAPIEAEQSAAEPQPIAALIQVPTPPQPDGHTNAASADRPTLDETRRRYFAGWRESQPGSKKFVAFQGRDIVRGHKRGFRLGPLSIELRAGEISAVVGRNASGKTTFLRLATGELRPDSGQLSYPALQEPNSRWIDIRSQIAFVPQLPDRWYGRLRNTLNYVAASYGVRGAANKELVDWHVSRYGLTEYENATWDEISGGFKIRFELVRAMVSQPRILVLDEPLAYLDVVAREKFLIDLRSIASSLENPMPILIASQHLYEIEAVADQIVILDDGNCLFSGSLESVAQNQKKTIIEVSLRAAKADAVEALQSLTLESIEETTEGFILLFPAETSHEAIFSILHRRFNHEFYAFRDISRSTRSLMSDDPRLAGMVKASEPELRA